MTRLLARYLAPYRAQLLLVVALVTVQAIANLYLPNLNADIINNGIVKGDLNDIVRTGALMLGVTLLLGAAAIVASYFAARTAMAFGRDVRGAVFRRVLDFSPVETGLFGASTRNKIAVCLEHALDASSSPSVRMRAVSDTCRRRNSRP